MVYPTSQPDIEALTDLTTYILLPTNISKPLDCILDPNIYIRSRPSSSMSADAHKCLIQSIVAERLVIVFI